MTSVGLFVLGAVKKGPGLPVTLNETHHSDPKLHLPSLEPRYATCALMNESQEKANPART